MGLNALVRLRQEFDLDDLVGCPALHPVATVGPMGGGGAR